MKTRTFFLLAGTVGAGVVLTRMIRGRRHEQEAQTAGKRPHRRRNALVAVGVGAMLARANRSRKQKQEAQHTAE